MFYAFLRSQSGAVTVDWVVLTSAIVGLGLATAGVVAVGVGQASNTTSDMLEDTGNTIGAFNFGRGTEILAAMSFDDIVYGQGGWSRNLPAGWIGNGNAGTWNPNASAFTDGTEIDGNTQVWVNRGGFATVDAGASYEAGQTYSLNFDAGSRSNYGNTNYTATVYAGTTAIGTYSGTTNGGTMGAQSFSTDINDASLNGQAITVRFQNTGGGAQTNFDNVSMTAD